MNIFLGFLGCCLGQQKTAVLLLLLVVVLVRADEQQNRGLPSLGLHFNLCLCCAMGNLKSTLMQSGISVKFSDNGQVTSHESAAAECRSFIEGLWRHPVTEKPP